MRVEIPVQSLITDHDVWFLDSTIIRHYEYYINIRNYRLNLRHIQRELVKSKVKMIKINSKDIIGKKYVYTESLEH